MNGSTAAKSRPEGEGGMPTPTAHHRTGLRVLNFAAVNAIAALGAAGLYWLVARGDASTGFFERSLGFFLEHETVMVLAALAPLLASLLVGYGYMQRARRRRAREDALRAIEAARAAGQ